jgi:hypothetical protein
MSAPGGGFTRFLCEQRHRDDPVGDLARDVARDDDWPTWGRRLVDFEHRIETADIERGSGGWEWAPWGEALAALRAAWAEYQERDR